MTVLMKFSLDDDMRQAGFPLTPNQIELDAIGFHEIDQIHPAPPSNNSQPNRIHIQTTQRYGDIKTFTTHAVNTFASPHWYSMGKTLDKQHPIESSVCSNS